MAKNASDRPSVFLGCFGKHPGWNDHIDDIGVETEELAELKRLLYVQGVGGNIDAGSWENLPEGGRIGGFGHVFLWRRRGSLFFGRLWASTDGKGRSAYPMIVCAQSRGPGLAWVLKTGLPALATLEHDCKSVKTADEVRSAVERTLSSLRASSSGAAEALAPATPRIAEPGLLGDRPESIDRVLYIVQRELKGFMPAKGGSTSVKSVDARPQHLRVPRAEAAPEDAVALWGRFIAEHTAKGAPILAMAPVEHPWVDLVVGEPDEPQFLCMLASSSTIPPVTEVPYTIDEKQLVSGRAMLERSVEPGAMDPSEDRAGFREAVSGLGAGLERMRSGSDTEGGSSKRTLVLGVLLAVVVIVAIVMLLAGGGGQTAEQESGADRPAAETRSARVTPAEETPAVAPAGPSEDAAARWEALCVAYERWFLAFSRDVDRDLLGQDEHLSRRVLPVIEQADELSPTAIAGRGAPRLERLRTNPPLQVWEPDAMQRTRAALDAVSGVRTALQAPAWPARGELEEAAARLLAMGWNAGADELRRVSSGVDFDSGERLAAGVERVLNTGPSVETMLERLRLIEAVGGRARATGDPVLERFEMLARGPGRDGQGALAEAQARLERAESLGVRLAAFLDDDWPRIDRAALREGASGVYQRASAEGATPELFHDWLAAAQRDVHRLPEGPDPREGWGVQERIASLREQLGELVERHGQAAAELVAGAADQLDEAAARAESIKQGPWRRATEREITSGVQQVETALRSIDRGISDAGLRLSRDHSDYIRALRETESVSQIGSEAIDKAWKSWRDELLSAYERPEDRLRLADGADAAQDILRRIETDASETLSAFAPPETGGAVRAASLRRLLDSRREQLIERGIALASWTPGDGPAEAFERLWTERLGREGRALDEIGRHLSDAAAIDRHIESGLAIDAPLQDGRAIGDLRRAWEGDDLATDLRPAMEPLLDRLGRIDRIASMSDPSELSSVVSEGASLSVALAAWRRLDGISGWPLPEHLASEVQAQDRLRALAREIDDEASRTRVLEELESGAAARWAAAAGRASSPSAIREAMVRQDALGGRIDRLPFRARFNAQAVLLERELSTASDDEAALAALERFVDGVDGTRSVERLEGEDREWLTGVIELASGADAGPAIDFASLGPGVAGWGFEADPEGRSVVYRHPEGHTELAFVGVSTNGATVFVGLHEVSVGVFARAVGEPEAQAALRERWPALAAAMDGGVSDRWQGPRSWAWDTERGIVPSRRWLSWDEAAGPAHPQGLDPERPTDRSPMQMVSFEAASAMAEAVGCRLPTASEWRAALGAFEDPSPAGEGGRAAWNIRDATWSRQLEHALARERRGLAPPWPDAGAFVARGVGQGGDARAWTDLDDGTLWFEPVDADRGGTLRHMVGNVAEWVATPGTGTGQGVIGGSALSDRSLAVDEAIGHPLARQQSYSDVGFRLAFGFEGEIGASARRTAEQFLRTLPFLEPRGDS
ncbi:MAG: hypothetical protein EA423_03860 [Phycisphaerales bacterium]|nr:MAG: hypothetical protein EA423_03860 [Phycisphaerales bacterium]